MNSDIKSILLLGATGKIGRHLQPLLTARGTRVRGTSRQAHSPLHHFDWQDESTYAPALAEMDAVFLVPPALVEDPSKAVSTFLEEAKHQGVQYVVAVSSQAATFPTEPEQSGRRRFEAAIKQGGLSWTLLQPTGFSQNFSEGFFLPGILHSGSFSTASGQGKVPFVDTRDIARFAATVLTQSGHAGQAYLITGPEALTYDQAATTISTATTRATTHQEISSEEMRGFLKRAQLPEDYIEMLIRDMEAVRDGFGAAVSPTVQVVTGQPPRTFQEFVVENAQVWEG